MITWAVVLRSEAVIKGPFVYDMNRRNSSQLSLLPISDNEVQHKMKELLH